MAQIKLAEYTFNNSVGDCLPTLTPDTITMTKNDTVDGTTTRRIIYIDDTTMPTGISFSGFKSLLTIDYLIIDSNINEVSRMFQMCTNLTSINTHGWNTATVTDISYMFANCPKLTSLDLSNFNTQQVTNMSDMFYGCSSLASLDLSNFNTQQVTNMSNMFYGCSSLTSLNLSNFNTQQVTNMSYMFRGCSSLASLDLKSFNTEKVFNMSYMFYGCSSLASLDLKSFNTQQVINTSSMFTNWTSKQEVYISYKWTIDNSTFTPTFIRSFNITLARYTFNNSIANCLPTITGITTSQWSYSDEVDGTITTRTIGTDEELTITNISFQNKTSLLTLDYLNFTNAITNATNMFGNCTALTSVNALDWDTSNVTNMSSMFQNCSALTTLDLSSWKVDSVTNMSNMFYSCSSLTSLNTSNWNTSKVSNMSKMFQLCVKLTTLDLSHFNVDAVTDMNFMFGACSELKTLDLSQWKTTALTNMSNMFHTCRALTNVDLSNFNTSKVTNMSGLFINCSNLTMVDLSNFDTSKVTTWGSFGGDKLTNIGLVYASSSTINSIVTNWLGTSVARNVYYMDAELSELTTRANITYVPYSQSVLSCSEEITLRSNGDVYDELDLLTGQVIQRIGEDNEILEEEIVRTIELDGEISFYENSYIHTSSNEITPEFEFQPTLTNCYAVSDLKPNTQYTILFEGNPTLMYLGGTTVENPISKIMITSGEVDNILWFDTSVSKIMILEGDLTNRDVEYFTGVKSSQKIEVQLRGNTPYFAKGGRK